MATISELNKKIWEEWVESRPVEIQKLCRKFPPDRLYKIKNSNHKVTIISYNESGSMNVDVSGEYNLIVFERQVFGIEPDNLEECDLPNHNEPLGVKFTDSQEIDKYLDKIRPEILRKRGFIENEE